MYLLDTNVFSETRRPRPHGGVMAWLSWIPQARLFVSAMSTGEFQRGIELTRMNDAGKAREIKEWLDQLLQTPTIIAADAQIFRVYARLMHKKNADLMEDALIAATAIVHDLTVATRNVKDFRAFDVRTFNPFAG